MDYASWEKAVPDAITRDPLWRMRVYRLSLFVADVGWPDVTGLARDRRTTTLSDQLYRALGSIGANIAEGYSRSSTKDQTRFYEYALGSARESRDWYWKARHILGKEATDERLSHLSEIIRLLLTIVAKEHRSLVREDRAPYVTEPDALT
ncbi:MAG: four helix bundle protein [Armatimonadetes bacterium]|nr:four helix bundle protein [Armatimonadota bacterium]